MSYPTITSLPDAPQRGEAPETFSTKANAWVAAIDGFTDEVNAAGAFIETSTATVSGIKDDAITETTAIKDDAITETTAIKDAAVLETTAIKNDTQAIKDDVVLIKDDIDIIYENITGATNFKGSWSTLTGALNVPASVEHNGKIWQLLVNLPNVALSEPSYSNNQWLIAGGVQQVVETTETNITLEEGVEYWFGLNAEQVVYLPDTVNNVKLINTAGTTKVVIQGDSVFSSDTKVGLMEELNEVWTLKQVNNIFILI